MFTEEQIREIQRRLQEIGVKDSQFPEAHALIGGEKVPILQDSENRLMNVTDFKSQVSGIPETISPDASLRVVNSLNNIDLRVKCFVTSEQGLQGAKSYLFFQEENNDDDINTGRAKNFQRFLLNDKSGRVITVDIIGKYTVATAADITIKVSGDAEVTDIFTLKFSREAGNIQGYFGEITFSSKYTTTNKEDDVLFVQAVSDKSNTYPNGQNYNLVEMFTITGSLKDYMPVVNEPVVGGLVGKQAKAFSFANYNFWTVFYNYLSDDEYLDYYSSEEDFISVQKKAIGMFIDSFEDGIDMDEITPKILVESDDRYIGFYTFVSSYMEYMNDNQVLPKKSSNTKSTVYPSDVEDEAYPIIISNNVVMMKQNNAVLKCIEDNFDAWLYFLDYCVLYEENTWNSIYDDDVYANDAPIGVVPYSEFSGQYTTENIFSDLNPSNSRSANNTRNSETKTAENKQSINSKSLTGKDILSTKERVEALKERIKKGFSYDFKSNSKNQLQKKVQTKSASIDDDDALEDDNPIDKLLDSDREVDNYEVINSFMDYGYLTTFTLKKYMICFYKYMTIFRDPNFVYPVAQMSGDMRITFDILGYLQVDNVKEILTQEYSALINNEQPSMEVLEEWDKYMDLIGMLQWENFDHSQVASLLNRESYQTRIKEMYDAISDFDVLLGSSQNVPYEDTFSSFFKYQGEWYEIILPFWRSINNHDVQIFEPNREYKLVHLGDWKRVETDANYNWDYGNFENPDEKWSEYLDEYYNNNYYDGDDNGGGGGNIPISK